MFHRLAIKHFDKERTNVVTTLNLALHKTRIKQDDQNKYEIFELCNQRIQANSKLKKLKNYLTDLNKEIGLWQKREYKKQIELNLTKEKQKIFGNVEGILSAVSSNNKHYFNCSSDMFYLTTYSYLHAYIINNQLSR